MVIKQDQDHWFNTQQKDKMKIEIGYQYPHTRWSVFHVFKKLHEKLKEKFIDVEFEYLEFGSKYKGEPGGIYSPHLMTIKNKDTEKYFVISYWDHMNDLTYSAHGWKFDLCKGIISSCGNKNNIDYIPSSYLCYDLIFDELHLSSKHMSEKENNDLMFRGYLYGDRLNLKNYGALNITDQKNFPVENYFNELTNNRINLSLNGAAEICNRDMEILSSRSVLFRPLLFQKFYNELIPDYHYISFEYSSDPKKQTEIILDKFNLIKDNVDFLTFISENGYNWFRENGTVESNVRILNEILNEDKLKELL